MKSTPATTVEPRTVAEIIDAVHRGTIGHKRAMTALRLNNYNELVDVMHANGKALWAHRPARRPSRALMDVIAEACGRPARQAEP